VVFVGWVDGELESGITQRSAVAREIRRLQPEVVLGHDPWRRYRLHPDHRHAGRLAAEGIVAARDPHFFPEHRLAHWRPSTLLLWEADDVDHVEDVTEFVDAKLAALFEHRTQLRSTMDIEVGADGEAAQRDRFERRVRDRLATFGRTVGVAAGEGFKRIDDL
jgi:LmbE family N-acetylglucosaminyl deacetylase